MLRSLLSNNDLWGVHDLSQLDDVSHFQERFIRLWHKWPEWDPEIINNVDPRYFPEFALNGHRSGELTIPSAYHSHFVRMCRYQVQKYMENELVHNHHHHHHHHIDNTTNERLQFFPCPLYVVNFRNQRSSQQMVSVEDEYRVPGKQNTLNTVAGLLCGIDNSQNGDGSKTQHVIRGFVNLSCDCYQQYSIRVTDQGGCTHEQEMVLGPGSMLLFDRHGGRCCVESGPILSTTKIFDQYLCMEVCMVLFQSPHVPEIVQRITERNLERLQECKPPLLLMYNGQDPGLWAQKWWNAHIDTVAAYSSFFHPCLRTKVPVVRTLTSKQRENLQQLGTCFVFQDYNKHRSPQKLFMFLDLICGDTVLRKDKNGEGVENAKQVFPQVHWNWTEYLQQVDKLWMLEQYHYPDVQLAQFTAHIIGS